jgi:hypothetical protein
MDSTKPIIPKFERTLTNLLRARFPYLYIATWEEARAVTLISAAAKNGELIRTTRRVLEWSLTQGFVENGRPVEGDTKAPLKALDFVEACQDAAVFVLKDFHVFMGANGRPADLNRPEGPRSRGSPERKSEPTKCYLHRSRPDTPDRTRKRCHGLGV